LWFEDIEAFRESHLLLCVLATTLRRAWIVEMLERKFSFTTLVHPASHVSRRTALGTGVSVDVSAVIAGYSEIGDHVRIGRGASCGHHTSIGAFSTIHPGAIISGNCRIGSGVTVGAGAVVVDGVAVGDNAVIAAGSVVTKNVPETALFAGNRGTVLRRRYGPI
jgi:sugar O-acyltransferase (sialic acid O-acetyltransferase NeuD family)